MERSIQSCRLKTLGPGVVPFQTPIDIVIQWSKRMVASSSHPKHFPGHVYYIVSSWNYTTTSRTAPAQAWKIVFSSFYLFSHIRFCAAFIPIPFHAKAWIVLHKMVSDLVKLMWAGILQMNAMIKHTELQKVLIENLIMHLHISILESQTAFNICQLINKHSHWYSFKISHEL